MSPTRSLPLPLVLALLALLAAPPSARAHDAGEARLDVRTEGSSVAIELTMARIDALDLLGLEPDATLDDARLFASIASAVPEWLRVEAPEPCHWTDPQVAAAGLRGVTISTRSPCPEAEALDWRAARHPRLALRAVGTLTMGGEANAFTLGKLDAPLRLGAAPGIGAFVLSGVEHILIGWDHLAFLLAILLGCSTLRRVVAVVTAFTVAHSITLALGATGVVDLPSGPVEAVIAASIAVAAAMGLLRWRAGRLDHPGRADPASGSVAAAVSVCFGFGLVHGLGFAGLLAEMLPPDASMVGPLVAFNVGVELGQITVVALAFPVLAAVGRRPSSRRILPALLAALTALGALVTASRLLG